MSKKVLNIISIIIPLVVAALFGIKIPLGEWTKGLPFINALLNSATAFFLILALVAVKVGNVKLHRNFIFLAVVLGLGFLVNYVMYHMSNEAAIYKGNWGGFYYPLLIVHILLAIVEIWFVLRALYFALNNEIIAHKKIVKFAYPIWLFVSVSGVIVYIMISPYYV
jgi:putative membrane protein